MKKSVTDSPENTVNIVVCFFPTSLHSHTGLGVVMTFTPNVKNFNEASFEF